MEMISAYMEAGAVAPSRALTLERALAPCGYLASATTTTGFTAVAKASTCAPTMRTRGIQATKPAAWQFADVRNHRTRRLWEPSQ